MCLYSKPEYFLSFRFFQLHSTEENVTFLLLDKNENNIPSVFVRDLEQDGGMGFVKDNFHWCKIDSCCVLLGVVGYTCCEGGTDLRPEKFSIVGT